MEANLKENVWELGVLRSMGVTHRQLHNLTLREQSLNIVAATLTGYGCGHLMGTTSSLMLCAFDEIQFVFNFNWPMLITLLLFSLSIVWVSTQVCMAQLKAKNISSILKGI